MLTAQVPQQEVRQIDCKQIMKFANTTDAKAYSQLNGGMVIHEQGKNIWYVMPAYNDVLIGVCLGEE